MREQCEAQRGVALFLAIFALLLLSAVGMAMLFSSDTETTISINYRDKQAAIYGALAGLQEARDRIHPLAGDLGVGTNLSTGGLNIAPTALPSSGAAQVLYLINPAAGETVAPWDPTNKYFDDELCHEKYFVDNLGITAGSAGVPCPASSASVPSGSNWYLYYDNSQQKYSTGGGSSGTGTGDAATLEAAYHLTSGTTAVPLTYKWVRVNLKSDNMTPVSITGGAIGSATQVCWDQTLNHEQLLPSSGYHPDCTPIQGGITNIAVTANGSGYTSAPTVSITGGSGSGATAVATIGQLPSGITSAALSLPNMGGAGYTSVPNVTITDATGTGAIVNAVLNGTVAVTSVTPQNPPNWASPPACYPMSSSPTVSFNPSGATASVTMTSQSCVYSFTVSGKCRDSSPSTVTASGGFVGSVSWNSNHTAKATSVSNPGNYSGSLPGSSNFTVGCSNPVSGSAPAVTPNYGRQISTISGSGGTYQPGNPPIVTVSGGSSIGGTPAAVANLSSTFNPTAVDHLVIPVGGNGSGYTAPVLSIAPPGCVPGPSCVTATGTASIAANVGVLSVQVTNAGSGYSNSNPPTVTFTGGVVAPPGSVATAVANVGSAASSAFMGATYLLTSMAETKTGARALAQMEVAPTYNQFNLGLGGALTMIGPNPWYNTPNAQNLMMIGTDCPTCQAGGSLPPTCNTTPKPARDAIGVDDPTGATSPSAIQDVVNGCPSPTCNPPTTGLGKPNNYIGANSSPDVHNADLGDMSPTELNNFVAAVAGIGGTNLYCDPTHPSKCGIPPNTTPVPLPNPQYPPPNPVNLGTAANPATDVIYGDYTLSGSGIGYGTLVVTGTLTLSGTFSWNGLIFVIGDGNVVMDGGGNKQINGAMYVANTSGGGSTVGSPSFSWNGGGTNTIQYNHCWADDLLSRIPFNPGFAPNALQVISLRTEVY